MDASVSPVFWILAAVIILSAIAVVSLKNIFHCALFLILCLFSVAGIFILLHAEFLAAAQVLIYVGAVAILIIFAIMLTTNLASRTIQQVNKHALTALFGCALFVLAMVGLFRQSGVWNWTQTALPDENVLTIGKLLMTKYMLPFEVVSVLLLAALIGAIALAREEKS
ncbi:NADH-quinone oxidoreductase subunit J [candidate division GN15 bacterium]|nr:NADH-quinone oxidoreductase subunit J [candidate division GN15 bacterium]